jgi:hypothetical protein
MFWVAFFRAWHRYRFFIDLGFDTFTVRTCNLLTHIFFVFTKNFNDFAIQRNMIFDDFPVFFSSPVLALICYEFWYRFWIHFETPLASNSMSFGDRFLYDLLISVLMQNCSKNGLAKCMTIHPFCKVFVTCFRTLLPFIPVRPTSARNHVFHFYLRTTYKCAMTVFTIF